MVTVGIPAYGRPESLERAVRSVLAQTHADLEVIVSDDASPDPAVAAAATRLAAEDPRVRFTRQPVNLGHDANYEWVRREARGEWFMWLSDDDWLSPSYVADCLAALRSGAVLAAGVAEYGGIEERALTLTSARPGVRLLSYFARVNMNGALFGVSRLADRPPFPSVVGGDWFVVASMALRGLVVTVPGARIHRSATGLGSREEDLARGFGLAGWRARHHHLVIAARIARTFRPRPAAVLSAVVVVLRFEGPALLRQLGLGRLEDAVVRAVQRREGRRS